MGCPLTMLRAIWIISSINFHTSKSLLLLCVPWNPKSWVPWVSYTSSKGNLVWPIRMTTKSPSLAPTMSPLVTSLSFDTRVRKSFFLKSSFSFSLNRSSLNLSSMSKPSLCFGQGLIFLLKGITTPLNIVCSNYNEHGVAKNLRNFPSS